MSSESLIVLDEGEWSGRQQRHLDRVEPWITPRRKRRDRGESHPVDDFLFDYYPYSAGKLKAWHPGHGYLLVGAVDAFLDSPAYRQEGEGATVDLSRLSGQRTRLAFAIDVLSATAGRAPGLGCFGMHEWAMVYRLAPTEVRHSTYPLRLSPDEIADVVDDVGLRCTHIDAYRFFSPAAAPLNAHEPTRVTQPQWDQPGCLHANMDLYKYSMWFQPFVGSELAADCFELARGARNLDMAASPYDMTGFGLGPIRVESADGRKEYVAAQRELMNNAEPLRERLASALSEVNTALDERHD